MIKSVSAAAGVFALCATVGAAFAQTPQKSGAIHMPKTGEMGRVGPGPKQLTPMFVPERLFTPEKRWKYEGHESELPPAYSVEQHGELQIGSRLEPNHGAYVNYYVTACKDTAEAQHVLHRHEKKAESGPQVQRSVKSAKYGDESLQTVETLFNNKKQAVQHSTEIRARFGRFVIVLSEQSDMKAFGPRPNSGTRRWLGEPVLDRVRDAVIAKWSNYKTLLASK